MARTRLATRTAAPPSRAAASRGRRRFAAGLTVFALLVTASVVSTSPTVAFATTYPSWKDVQQARHNAAAKRAEIRKIKGIIKGLDAKVKSTSAVAQAKGDTYGAAQDAYYSAAITEKALDTQAKAADALRKQSEAQAGQLASQLARSGGGGFQLNLFLNGANAANVLDGIGTSSKLSESADAIYEKAVQDKNAAQALTDQANVAKTILNNLKIVAQAAYEDAQHAATAAASALAESTAHRAALEGLLKVLNAKYKITQKQYLKGLQVKYGINGGTGTEISSKGWARPTIGRITSGFGMRVNPITGVYGLHSGVDLADGCNVPIYAAHTGTVTYSGWYGGLGYFIRIQADAKFGNGYGHIAANAVYAHYGDQVHVGQLIARTGETGEATGCHLHFMVIDAGVPINPVPFMRGEGIVLG